MSVYIHDEHDVVSVMALGSSVDESKQVSEAAHEDGNVVVSEDNSDQPDSASFKRRSLKGKPRIPTAVDTSRLNKHLTNIWSSKRKKLTKKSPSSVPLDLPRPDQSDVLMESEMEVNGGAAESKVISSQASTVIIVKTLPQKDADSYHLPTKESIVSEVQKGSRDIAERLKARKQRLAVSLGGGDVDASVNNSGQVICELCAETVGDYVQLVRHVCQQHEDCTYVRNYLDELQPIADALSAVSLPCNACARTFAGQAALAAHRHECSAVSKTGRVSKLGAQRRRVTASLLSPSEHAGDHQVTSAARTPREKTAAVRRRQDDKKGAHRKRTFSSQEKRGKHVARVHSEQSGSGRRAKVSAAAGASSNSAQSSVSASQFQRCDHCTASFSRTSLLVTHMRYCLKAGNNR